MSLFPSRFIQSIIRTSYLGKTVPNGIMSNGKRRGPKIEPWGTPKSTLKKGKDFQSVPDSTVNPVHNHLNFYIYTLKNIKLEDILYFFVFHFIAFHDRNTYEILS